VVLFVEIETRESLSKDGELLSSLVVKGLSVFIAVVFCSSPLSFSAGKLDALLPDDGDAFVTFLLDNDMFAQTDQDYTNGARLSWISAGRDVAAFNGVQNWLRKFSGDEDSIGLFRKLSGFGRVASNGEPLELEYNYGFSLTQLMFTPEDLKASAPPVGQRPYAGWLGIGFSIHVKDDRVLNSTELAIGVVGEKAFAQETQDFVHELKGIELFQGWDSQIPTEVTMSLAFNQKRRLAFLESGRDILSFDGFGEWGFVLGNFRTNGYLGAMLRLGWNLPVDFSDPRISESAYSHQLWSEEGVPRSSYSLYALAGVRGIAVAHDITLDGSLFRDYETGVQSKPFVGEVYLGVGLRLRHFEFSYSHTFRSEEFGQENRGQQFGSLAIRYRY
tara:strand:+ start:532 stop:1695 length:1164 start_codon:yes stop_codon:yes gene_type:complete